jgi:hypothetical protein
VLLLLIALLLVAVAGVYLDAALAGIAKSPRPDGLVRTLPGAGNVFSRLARGTWDLEGPAPYVDLPNGHRYGLFSPWWQMKNKPATGLEGFVTTGTPIWPDTAWYVQQDSSLPGFVPGVLLVRGRNGKLSMFTVPGIW